MKKEEKRRVDTIVIENARIGFRNFSGKEGRYNPKGRRNFCVFIDDEKVAKDLETDGWNIRWLQPIEDGEEPKPYLQVSVSYDNVPPKIVLVTKHGKSILDDTTVNVLDWADIETIDLIIRPYSWEVNGKKGIKAYVKSMYVTITEDKFEEKYFDVPDSAANNMEEPLDD